MTFYLPDNINYLIRTLPNHKVIKNDEQPFDSKLRRSRDLALRNSRKESG